jgi:hypothetical protein
LFSLICNYGAKFEFNWAKLKQTKEIVLRKRCYVISRNIYHTSGQNRSYLNKFNNLTIKTFYSSTEASRIKGIHQTSLVANGKTAEGYIWK